MPKKQKNLVFTLLFIPYLAFISACTTGSLDSYYLPANNDTHVYVPTTEYVVKSTTESTTEPMPEPIIESVSKVAIIADEFWQRGQEYSLVAALSEKHGNQSIVIYTWPTHYNSAETIAIIDDIITAPEIKVLLINPAFYETDHLVSLLREQRDDIFIISNTDLNANLILEVDADKMLRTFPRKAYELGAKTLVYFYDSSVAWVWGEEDIIKEEYVKSDQHIMTREKSEEIGLRFIDIDIAGAIQCGSSYAMFMAETLPLLIENYGNDIVFFNLDNERLFWSWRGLNMIYLPTHSPWWFEPTPADIAKELLITDISTGPALIQEIRTTLEEQNRLGRIASFPVSSHLMLPITAVEYGMRWANGEVSTTGIDLEVLEQIMMDFIVTHSGETGAVILTEYLYPNHILVYIDFIIY